MEGKPLVTLSHSISDEEGTCQIDLANPFLPLAMEAGYLSGSIHVRRRRAAPPQTQRNPAHQLHPSIVNVRVGLKTEADFRDIFEVRGLERAHRGEMLPPHVEPDEVVFRYRGLDAIERKTHILLDPPANRVVNDSIFWQLQLERGKTMQLQVEVTVSERPLNDADAHTHTTTTESAQELPALHMDLPVVQSDNVFFNRVLARGMHDLIMMCTPTAEGLYPYGGIPWYACPFGRDALITSLEFLPWFPEVARGTLAFLAAHQGRKVDPFTEEQPGRILHEYRSGEMANCREIPFIPYYGTVDATPLFLMLFEPIFAGPTI